MQWLDWTIVAGLLAFLTFMAVYTRRYTRSVADFLVANRTAGRYLLCVCDGMAALGAITIVMMFELYYEAGFPVAWWDMFRIMIIPTVLSLSGWVIYRFRETRALTLAQFFEMRYSKNFRVFSGLLIWFSGIVNFGIFPAVGARFFLNFLGIPETTLVYVTAMLILLAFSLFFTFMGGQIAVMVTDFIQGVFCNIMFVIIIIVVFSMFKWDQILEVLNNAPAGASMVHPFKVQNAENFNMAFYMILAFTASYGFLSWQGAQGYNAAARNAHEARMGKSLSVWRMLIQNLFMMVLPVCAYTFMKHPDFFTQSAAAKAVLASIQNNQIQKQVSTAVALRYFLPTGIMGGLVAVMIGAFISTHDTYLHSWGSIFVQDVILPFRKKPLKPDQHIRLLKWSIFGVAVFIFFFSLFFRQTEAIVMFFQITGVIFMGGAGTVIIGGLYWKRGTTAGAWAGMITGAVLGVGCIVLQQIHDVAPFDNRILAYIASKNGAILSFWASVAAIAMYIIFSLAGKKQSFNLDKMLHRGKYAVADDKTVVDKKPVSQFRALIGMGSDFNLKDKIVYLSMVIWTLALVILFIAVTVINLSTQIPDGWWITFWKWYIWISLVMGSLVTVWFTIGGIKDMKDMFKRLSAERIDEVDDGRVIDKN
jgi:SSS family solute:Na+ symporter